MEELVTRNPERLTRELLAKYLTFGEIPPSEDLATQVATFNAEVAKNTSLAASTARAVEDAVANVTDTEDANALLDAIDAKRRHLISDAQSLARLWSQRVELTKLTVEDYQQAADEVKGESTLLRDEINQGLTELGFIVEETNGINFAHVVERGHPAVRAKLAQANEYRQRGQRLQTEAGHAKEIANRAKLFVRVVADRIASGKV